MLIFEPDGTEWFALCIQWFFHWKRQSAKQLGKRLGRHQDHDWVLNPDCPAHKLSDLIMLHVYHIFSLPSIQTHNVFFWYFIPYNLSHHSIFSPCYFLLLVIWVFLCQIVLVFIMTSTPDRKMTCTYHMHTGLCIRKESYTLVLKFLMPSPHQSKPYQKTLKNSKPL